LGSAIIELKVKAGSKTSKIVFSGDLGNDPVPFLRAPATINDADYLLVESAYGDRRHESSAHCQRLVEDAAEEIAAKKGVLMIPSFALERTQQILYHLNNLIEQRKIPQMPIFLDSPLAVKITQIYKKHPQYYDAEALTLIREGDDVLKFPGLEMTPTLAQSKKINHVPPPKIIIAGSGMSQGGRIVHHESFYLSDPRNILLIVAYQAKGTLGRAIADGAKEVEILDQKIPVRAKVEQLSCYSGHADSEQLFKWVSCAKYSLKKVFVVQGEEKPAGALAQRIKDDLGIEAFVPDEGQVVEL
jgi:metallo-beta-lactamase family protein